MVSCRGLRIRGKGWSGAVPERRGVGRGEVNERRGVGRGDLPLPTVLFLLALCVLVHMC